MQYICIIINQKTIFMKQLLNFILFLNAYFCAIFLLNIGTCIAHYFVCAVCFSVSFLHLYLVFKFNKNN